MKAKSRQSGLTLTEQAVVIAAIALLVVFGLPAVRAFFRSVESHGGARAMISAGLASARAIAAKEQRYAGIRFQHAYYKDDPDNSPLKAPQYMIFIVQDPQLRAYGFRAVEGLEPIKLPDTVGVMDLRKNYNEKVVDVIREDDLIDTTTFSIVFSPSGKLVIHEVRTINRDGEATATVSKDDMFNVESNVKDGVGMFVQDDDSDKEPSRSSFIIYDKDIFEKVDKGSRYDDYLKDLEVIYINPYTGTMINR